jgi:hypothetical protein
MRSKRMTLRLTEVEVRTIQTFANQESLNPSEATRRLIFWNRHPGWTLPQPTEPQTQDALDDK